jgi:hypothetical protein
MPDEPYVVFAMAEPRRNDEPQREEFRNGGASPRRRLTRERRRALELLASDPYGGVTEELMLAKWFTVTMLAGLVRDGLAIARRDVVKAATKTPKVERYCITDAGRRALEG